MYSLIITYILSRKFHTFCYVLIVLFSINHYINVNVTVCESNLCTVTLYTRMFLLQNNLIRETL